MMILHEPFGQEHPYEQGPEERFPRQPLAGETFTIGIVIRPPQGINAVQVFSQLNDQPAQVQQAVRQMDWQAKLEEGVGADLLDRIERVEQDVWHAQMIAPAVGQTLTYWIEAGEEKSAVYSLCGEDWQVDAAPRLALTEHTNGWHLDLNPATRSEITFPQGLPALQKVEWLRDGGHARRVRLTFAATAGEAFYGLGERFNALNQRGEVLDIRCYEQYKSQGKRTYMPIPFLLSSQGYGLYVESARWMQFDLTRADHWTLEADLPADQSLRLTWFTGTEPFEVVGHYTLYTGKPALPPQWSLGLWMSGNEWNSQARVMHEVAQHEKYDIPVSALVIEAWSDETTFYIWNDAQYTPVGGDQALHHGDFTYQGKWPDPKGMVDTLHEKGIRVLLWQVPVFKQVQEAHAQHEADRTYFEQQRFGIRSADGESLYKVLPFWFRGGYMPDVTNPQAVEWWLNKRAYLLDEIGIDGFKTDGGEHLWGLHVQFADGRTGEELWNLYPKLYTEAYYNFATVHRADALLFSRAGFAGSQVSPAHWAGDENSTWEAYRHSILAGLSAGISGIIFWGWDLGGFSGEVPSAELYLRGAAMAAFCPIMQYHSEYNSHRTPSRDRTPWNIQERSGDERVIPFFRHFVQVRQKLMPYIWQEAQYAAQTGQPMMRALHVTAPQASLYQYYFGRDLLVCPVVEEGVTAMEIYLPAGTWRDLWTNEVVQGGQTITVDVPLDTIPVYVREGAAVTL